VIALQFPLQREIGSALWYVRTDAILWGVIVALTYDAPLIKKLTPDFMRFAPARVMISSALVASIPAMGLGTIASFHTGLIAAVCGVIVWLASYDKGFFSSSIKNNPVILWIASRSYSLYLIHGIGFRLVSHTLQSIYGRELNGGDIIMVAVLSTALCALLADLSYRLLEKRFIARGRAASDRIIGTTA